MQSFSIADARSQLPKIIHTVEEGDVTQLTRRGKPVAVLLSLKEYKALLAQGKGSLLHALKAYRVLKKDGNEDLSNEEVDSWRSKETGRELPWE
jgi:prevent-host-death family protein